MFDDKTRCVVLVGVQWGDEGKGKITDVLAEQATLVARYQGEMIFRQLFIEQGVYSLRALDTGLAEISLPNGVEDIVGVISQRSGKRRSEHKRYDV